ncbi:MAG: 6-carboxytetrahydropterin synthase [Fimbriimonadaceae bacterium]
MSGRTVRMWRRVVFSSGHRYWLEGLSEGENRRIFGRWASRFNHGHNYILELAVSGRPDPTNGMVVNIKTVDAIVRERIVSWVDGRSLNDEVPAFRNRSTSLENVALWIVDEVGQALPEGTELDGLYLYETEDLWVELMLDSKNREGRKLAVGRRYEFAASHRLHCDHLSEAENHGLYGKCNHPAGHGHNYVLEVTVEGELDPLTGMSVDLDELDRVVERLVLERYDHRNLDVDVPELRGKVTTSENVAIAIWELLAPEVPGRLRRVRLFETARNAFELEDWS